MKQNIEIYYAKHYYSASCVSDISSKADLEGRKVSPLYTKITQ